MKYLPGSGKKALQLIIENKDWKITG